MAGMSAPIPYFPGREDLLPMVNDGVAKAKIEEDNLIHPLAAGAEAYYRYEIGDSVTMKLPTDLDSQNTDPNLTSYAVELKTKVLTRGGKSYTYFDQAKAIRE